MKAERSPVCPSNPLRGLVRYGQTLTECLKSFRVCKKGSDCEFEDNQVLGSRVAADQKASIGPHRPFSPMYRLGTKPTSRQGHRDVPGRAPAVGEGVSKGPRRRSLRFRGGGSWDTSLWERRLRRLRCSHINCSTPGVENQ